MSKANGTGQRKRPLFWSAACSQVPFPTFQVFHVNIEIERPERAHIVVIRRIRAESEIFIRIKFILEGHIPETALRIVARQPVA